MKVLVCGGRDYTDWEYVYRILDLVHASVEITKIIHGGARGADSLAGSWAVKESIETEVYIIANHDWAEHGKKAGILRNQKMLDASQPDIVIAFPGKSGTAHMVKISKEAGYKVYKFPEDETYFSESL